MPKQKNGGRSKLQISDFEQGRSLLARLDHGAEMINQISEVVFAAEVFLQELLGPPLNRELDPVTGLHLWSGA